MEVERGEVVRARVPPSPPSRWRSSSIHPREAGQTRDHQLGEFPYSIPSPYDHTRRRCVYRLLQCLCAQGEAGEDNKAVSMPSHWTCSETWMRLAAATTCEPVRALCQSNLFVVFLVKDECSSAVLRTVYSPNGKDNRLIVHCMAWMSTSRDAIDAPTPV
ncbi:hypothetical protein BU24DRAFT_130011 [Aaosphaeria arxii CBS 175.79]|uniref:Uncharacterized protein n=1 Tax=Aaosphaeria arxii CBS 175.79 TaxID=1450172 RepID=A0A6A5Y316_9PLEO|nr:uncharacterized protein BU24DRAFT_130011 [Aaosphaeria arxii CBS 175.79]KAF2019942.1 hypothetical protein BU24DRAFT_130011 [Aaosphaeria arxii CBS 175.79]